MPSPVFVGILALCIVYLALVVFRHFLLIPSTVVIAAGGLCFGAATGAGLGALGIALCGLGQFALVRVLRPRWVLSQVDRNVWGLERIIERAGPWLVAVVTAHPAMPMSPVHLAAAGGPVEVPQRLEDGLLELTHPGPWTHGTGV